MKKSIYGSCFLLLVFTVHARLPFSHVITFFIQSVPFSSGADETKFNKTVTTPGKAACKIACSVVPSPNHGIFAAYGGYLVISDFNGQVTFPRMQQKTNFLLIVTEKIVPIMMLGNTVHHWETLGSNNAFYSIEREQDPKTQLYYWSVTAAQPPEKNIIPLTSIVIFAKPKNIIVPLGITVTNDNPQLILPTLYATNDTNNVIPALSALTIRQFFGSLSTTNKKENDMYYSTQINTTQ